jgi:hypothetical protein
MFARQFATRFSRANAGTQRRMITNFVEKESNVGESQKIFTSGHNYTHIKRDSDKVIYYALFGLFAVGSIQWLRGFSNMSRGVGKKQ